MRLALLLGLLAFALGQEEEAPYEHANCVLLDAIAMNFGGFSSDTTGDENPDEMCHILYAVTFAFTGRMDLTEGGSPMGWSQIAPVLGFTECTVDSSITAEFPPGDCFTAATAPDNIHVATDDTFFGLLDWMHGEGKERFNAACANIRATGMVGAMGDMFRNGTLSLCNTHQCGDEFCSPAGLGWCRGGADGKTKLEITEAPSTGEPTPPPTNVPTSSPTAPTAAPTATPTGSPVGLAISEAPRASFAAGTLMAVVAVAFIARLL